MINKNTYISKGERMGFIALIFITMLCHNISNLYSLTLQPTNQHLSSKSLTKVDMAVDTSKLAREKRTATIISEKSHSNYEDKTGSRVQKEDTKSSKAKIDQSAKISPVSTGFEFPDKLIDPNVASAEILKSYGFQFKTIQNIIKYRNAGGKFYNDSDLYRIYGIDSSHLEKVLHLIKIKDRSSTNNNKGSIPYASIDINKASIEELIQLRGIGPVLSKRIVELRKKLGGFYSLDQLKEVYGLPEDTFQSITKYLSISSPIEQFYPPSLSFKEVLRHPYMDYESTKLVKNISILNYKEEISVILASESIDKRVIPYISIEEIQPKTEAP